MARISSYDTDVNLTMNDRWIGSDGDDNNITKNFSPIGLVGLFNSDGTMGFPNAFKMKYTADVSVLPRPVGSISTQSGTDNIDMTSVSSLVFSSKEISEKTITDYISFSVGKVITINKVGDVNTFGVYICSGISEIVDEPGFYALDISSVGGNGSYIHDETYFISLDMYNLNGGGGEGTLDGSGAAGSIPLWASSSFLTNSIITQVNGNIGIDDPAPLTKLSLRGDFQFSTNTTTKVLFSSVAALGTDGGNIYIGGGGQGASRSNNVSYLSSTNTSLGMSSLSDIGDGYSNFAGGNKALSKLTTGHNNIGVGFRAGEYYEDGVTPNTDSSNSVYLGSRTKALTGNSDNEIVIGFNAVGAGKNSVVIGNSSIGTTYLKGNVSIGAIIDSDGATGVNGQSLTVQGGKTLWATTSGSGAINLSGLSDVGDVTGATEGQGLFFSGTTSKFEARLPDVNMANAATSVSGLWECGAVNTGSSATIGKFSVDDSDPSGIAELAIHKTDIDGFGMEDILNNYGFISIYDTISGGNVEYKVVTVYNDVYSDDFIYVELSLVGNNLTDIFTVGRNYRMSFFSSSKNSDGFSDLYACGSTSDGTGAVGGGIFTVNNVASSAVTAMSFSYYGLNNMLLSGFFDNLGYFIISSQDGQQKVAYKVATFSDKGSYCTYTLTYKGGTLTSFSSNKKYNVSFSMDLVSNGDISGSGTSGKIPMFINSTQLGDSLIRQGTSTDTVTVLGKLSANTSLGVSGVSMIGWDEGNEAVLIGDINGVYPDGYTSIYGNLKILNGIIDSNNTLGTSGHTLHTDGSNVYWALSEGGSSVAISDWNSKGSDNISNWSKTGIGGLSLNESTDGTTTYYALKLSTGDLVVKTPSSQENPITLDDYCVINKNVDETYRIKIGDLYNLMKLGELSMDISPASSETVSDASTSGGDYTGESYPLIISITDYNGSEVLLTDGQLTVESELNCYADISGGESTRADMVVHTDPRNERLLDASIWASVVIVFTSNLGGVVKKTFRVKWQGSPIF